jgi:hypothetical protein
VSSQKTLRILQQQVLHSCKFCNYDIEIDVKDILDHTTITLFEGKQFQNHKRNSLFILREAWLNFMNLCYIGRKRLQRSWNWRISPHDQSWTATKIFVILPICLILANEQSSCCTRWNHLCFEEYIAGTIVLMTQFMLLLAPGHEKSMLHNFARR